MNKLDGLKIAQDIALIKYGRCLSFKYINNYTKMLWECKDKHQWEASLHNIKDCNSWCPYCDGQRIDGLKTANKIALDKEGKCLSNNYTNAHINMLWQCKKQHIWMATLNNTKNKWCPECSFGKTQKTLIDIIKNIFPKYTIKNNFRSFNWLKTNKGGRQELDIFIPELKLAIEYDGEQHFRPVKFGGITKKRAEENLKIVKKLDKLKNKKIKEHSEDIKYFVRFNYKEIINEEYVRIKLYQLGIL